MNQGEAKITLWGKNLVASDFSITYYKNKPKLPWGFSFILPKSEIAMEIYDSMQRFNEKHAKFTQYGVPLTGWDNETQKAVHKSHGLSGISCEIIDSLSKKAILKNAFIIKFDGDFLLRENITKFDVYIEGNVSNYEDLI